jgi:hypothetical protein
MTAPYGSACIWVRIWPFISIVALFDVENREKTGDDNKHHRFGQMSARADPFSKSKYG